MQNILLLNVLGQKLLMINTFPHLSLSPFSIQYRLSHLILLLILIQATALISKLTAEKNIAIQQSNKLRQELVRSDGTAIITQATSFPIIKPSCVLHLISESLSAACSFMINQDIESSPHGFFSHLFLCILDF